MYICVPKEHLKELKSGSILEAYNSTSLFKWYFFVLIKINIYMVMLCQRQSQTTEIFFCPLLKKNWKYLLIKKKLEIIKIHGPSDPVILQLVNYHKEVRTPIFM